MKTKITIDERLELLKLVDENAYKKIMENILEPVCLDDKSIEHTLNVKMSFIKYIDLEKEDFEKYAIRVLSTIFGLDIYDVAVYNTREKLLSIIRKKYFKRYRKKMPTEFKKNLKYILENNIVIGSLESPETVIQDYLFNGDKVTIRKYYVKNLKDDEANVPFLERTVLINDMYKEVDENENQEN